MQSGKVLLYKVFRSGYYCEIWAASFSVPGHRHRQAIGAKLRGYMSAMKAIEAKAVSPCIV